MAHTPGLIWRFRIVIVVLATISLLLASHYWQVSERRRDEPAEELALDAMMFAGAELHASLRKRRLELLRDLPTKVAPPENPHVSKDDDFVEAIARGGSQGRLNGQGIRSALYARYGNGENEVGCYGLQAANRTEADRREKAIREIWAYNAGLNRAKVHRRGLLLIVLWHDGVSQECWESVNTNVETRLNTATLTKSAQ